MRQDLLAFFDAYRDAFDALDGGRVAALYAVPSGIAQGGVYTHWASPEPVRQNMTALCDLYRQRGYRGASYEPGAFIDQGPNHAVVDVRWRIDWDGGAEPWQFRTTYNLLRTAEGWRVLLCTAYTEDQLFQADGREP